MGIISTLICLALLLLCVASTKDGLKNPFVLYYTLWTGILFLSSLHLYGMYVASNKTYFLITLTNVFFFCGGLVKLPQKSGYIEKNREISLDTKSLCFFIAVSIIIKVMDFYDAVKKLNSGMELWQLRQDSFSVYDSSAGGFLIEVIRNVLVSPFNNIAIPLVAYMIFREPNRKVAKILTIYLILSTCMGIVSGGGGRLTYIYIGGSLIYSFLFLDKEKVRTVYRKYKRKIVFLSILLICALALFTVLKVGAENIFRNIYVYFGMQPTLLDVNLHELEGEDYTYGMLTLFGLHSYFFRFLDAVGLNMLIPKVYLTAYQYLLNANTFKQVGFGVANSFVSPTYYFYLDGGIAFVIFASFFFGVVISNSMRVIRKNMNIKKFCFYALIMYGVFLTFMAVETIFPQYILTFFMISFIFRKKQKKNLKISA